jgi:flagellar biosynthesis protein
VVVALKYDLGKDAAPRLIAKGKGDAAGRIVEIAEKAGAHVEHNEPLARSLSQLEFDEQIPDELFRAVV